MKKFIKKPVIIEAVQLTFENKTDVKELLAANKVLGTCENTYLGVLTLEGEAKLNIGDFLIKGVNNEFYPCSSNNFNHIYTKEESEL